MMQDNNLIKEHIFQIMLMVFISLLILANILSSKLIDILIFNVPVGILLYPFTFTITDIVSEIYGRKKANWIVFLGMISIVITFIVLRICIMIPPSSVFTFNKEFMIIFNFSTRITIASICSYIVSQYWDIFLFHKIKKITNNRYLWLRNNLSTMTSQFLDTVIFISIVFWGNVPNNVFFNILFSMYLFKVIIAIIDTPIVYYSVYLIKRRING